ncbi:MAG: bifunctional MaoC family dehydratase N-terminal/OB-fold nucleic acid binding domain-containing protein [Deltaproteobacteria bacterium]
MDSARQELESKFKDFVGLEIGPPQDAYDTVNEAMIRHWCEVMGDNNPVYTDADAAADSVHGRIVAPPSMIQAWMLPGLVMSTPEDMPDSKQTQLHQLLSDHGYTSVVATNCEQRHHRYLSPGDRIKSVTVIEEISEQKATAIGIGYFINTRETFHDSNGEEIGWQTFRVLKFKPHQQPEAVEEGSEDGQSETVPKRMRPPTGHDNKWWWEGIERDELLIQKCSDCGELRHPPRPMCPHCQSTRWEGQQSSGRGTVYSYVVLHYPKFPGYEFPLVCALVDLEEGTRLVSNVIGCDPQDVHIGMAVETVIEKVDDDFKLPLFRPAARETA